MKQSKILNISSLAGGNGFGVAHDNDFTLFIPFTVTKDQALIEWNTPNNKRWAIGSAKQILERSEYRKSVTCPYHPVNGGTCGGCLWAFIDLEYQRFAKKQILERAFRIHHIDFQVPRVLWRGPSLNYRWRARFAVSKDGKVGFRQVLSNNISKIDRCNILMYPDDVKKLHGIAKGINELSVQWSMDGRISIHMKKGFFDLRLARKRFKDRISLVTIGNKRIFGEPFSLEKKGTFLVSAGSFSQAGPWANDLLGESMMEMISHLTNINILELYAGAGNFTRYLSKKGKVWAVEENPLSCQMFYHNAPYATLIKASVEKGVFSRKDYDLVVIDPPRTGLSKKAFKVISEIKTKNIMLLSCDPMSGARDIKKIIDNGFVLENVRLIDAMPNTQHFEVISFFTKK